MILHIFPREKFTVSFINFINKNFNKQEHLFFVYGANECYEKNDLENDFNVKSIKEQKISFLKSIYTSDKIILHSLLISRKLLLFLAIQPFLLKKCNWVIWGGDLYHYKYRKRTFKENLYEYVRKLVIGKVGRLVSHIKGDYELAKEWYGAKGKYCYSFMYLSNVYKEYDISNMKEDKDCLVVQVGNSADITNDHIQIFLKLEKYKNENIEIICPISYGNIKYRDKVIEEGKKIFGDKFKPITNFIPFQEYLQMLARVDVAIFNHQRQQAVGNITTLLGLGKKVYIKDDITTWDFCFQHNLKVFNANSNIDDLFIKLSENDKLNNIQNVKDNFSELKLKNDLEKIFNS